MARSWFTICLLVLMGYAMAVIFVPPVTALEGPVRILAIHSYHPGFEWTRSLHQGLVDRLDEWDGSYSLSVEYMDTKRIYSQEHIAGLETLYKAKYAGAPPDLIIASDNNAFDMLYRRRADIFGSEVPVVFCGVNYFSRNDWPGMKRIVGIDEFADLDALIDTIDTIHTDKPPVAFLTDASSTGIAYWRSISNWVNKQENPQRYHILDFGYPDDMVAQLENMPPDTVLAFFTYVMDPDGKRYSTDFLLRRIDETFDIPIYGNYEWMLGRGIIGGPLIDSTSQGQDAAQLAIDVIEGRVNPDAFQLRPTRYKMAFDYPQLKSHGIPPSALPAGSIILNRPDVFWRQYPIETGMGVFIIMVLIVGIVILSRLFRQRDELLGKSQSAIRQLRLNERRLESLVNLTHMTGTDDGQIAGIVMSDALAITESCRAVVLIADGEGERIRYIYVPNNSGQKEHIMKGRCGDIIDRSLEDDVPLVINHPGGRVEFGEGPSDVACGIIRPCGDLKGTAGTSVVLGVFDKASAYGQGDIRQLTLLADGIWKTLARRRVENRLRELNTELEQRVEERSRELRMAEDELMRNEKLASLGSLVAGIAHEISTPLGIAVTGGSYLVDGIEKMNRHAQKGVPNPAEIAEFLDTGMELGRSLNSNLARAAALIRTFKQVAVDQSGEMHRLMNLADVFQDILDTLRGPLKKNHVSVDFQCPESVVFEHYPGDLGTILTNLVMNSLVHGYKAKDEGHITIIVTDEGDSVTIDYRDDGSGVPDSIVNRVFDPFFTTERNSGGTGLGLHIIRSIIVDRHGGRVELDGGEGHGVHFHIQMPKKSPAVARNDSGLTPV